MNVSDEQLMAYVDGELPDVERELVEQAIAQDATLAQRVADQRALRAELAAAFDPVLDEPVPPRLVDALNRDPTPAAAPVDLAAARERRHAAPARSRFGWPQWGAIAASLVIGVLAAQLFRGTGSALPITAATDGPRASGELAGALDGRLSGERTGTVSIAFSFRDRDGGLCRTFALPADGVAGLACRADDGWRIELLAPRAPGSPDAYAQASSALPASVLAAVDERIDGEALDAEAERAARARDWAAPAP